MIKIAFRGWRFFDSRREYWHGSNLKGYSEQWLSHGQEKILGSRRKNHRCLFWKFHIYLQLKFRDTMGLFVIELADIHDLKMPFGQRVVVGI